ncbi:SET domain-containing protein [Lachnellula suecica]|uniref:SET domain-containing protein n=1 Tax=Lachnellula suecica TaxID=602035 RepID=A0A8T9C4U9_9HELO|nr:SET domain-containing protein [Lachnellula suecica]
MSQTRWKDHTAYLEASFDDWYASKDCSWKQKYGPQSKRKMDPKSRSVSPCFSHGSKAGSQAVSKTQLLTPEPSPPPSPQKISPAKAWLLSMSATAEELLSASSSQSSPNSSFNSDSPVSSFSNDFFEVRQSPKGGLGAFAIADIPKDTVIMAEEPLFRAEPVEIYWKYDSLTDEQRQEYRTLSYWLGIEDMKVPARFTTNRFETGNGIGGIFLKSSRFNHACHPYSTCTYRWEEEKNTLTFTTLMEVKKGDEITISYTNKPKTLYLNYGFNCDCPACLPPKVEEKVPETSYEVVPKV